MSSATTTELDREIETLNEPHQLRERVARMSNAHGDGYDLKERGFFCRDCNSKCTLGLNGEEYGHYADCPHRNVDRDPNNLKGEL